QDAEQVLQRLAPLEREVCASDGRWYLRRVLPYRTTDNRIDGVVIAFADIHASKTAQEGLHRLAAVVRDSNDAVMLFDFEGKILALNQGAERAYGYTEAEARGRTIMMIIPRARRQEMRDIIERLRRGESIPMLEAQRRTRDGRTLEVWLTITAVCDEQGRPKCIASTERDITERKRNTAALVGLNRNLERQMAERAAVAEKHSVRLRELGARLLETEEVERRNLATDLHDNLAQVLHVASMKMADVRRETGSEQMRAIGEVEKLLAGAHQTARSLTYQLSPPILHELGLFPAVQWLAEEMKRQYHLNVRVVGEVHRPMLQERTRIVLFRAVRELLINVTKHARVRCATVWIRRTDSHVTLVVEDHGVGFDPQSVPNAKTSRGFGIFSIREKMAYLGGTMEIHSRLGRKTTVTLTAPLALQENSRGGR
ncbi:MAG: PAS domain S-box protein, partial [Tepidisphaeraceae bacterium]